MLLDSDPAVGTARATTGRHFPSLRRWSGWIEAVLIFAAYQAFDGVRSQVQGEAGPSLHHAQQVVDFERWFGLFQEARIQGWMLANHTLIQFWDIYYGTVHFIIPPLALVLAYRRCPARYRHHRDALVILSLLGMACFWLWPLAPPRLLPAHFNFVDTASTIGGMGPADRGHLKDDNLYAAMPSLHIAWAAWSAVVLVPIMRSWWTRLAAAAYPLITLTAVVVTANHFFLDAVGGLAVLAAGWLLATAKVRIQAAVGLRKRRQHGQLPEEEAHGHPTGRHRS